MTEKEKSDLIHLNLHDYDPGLKRLRIEASWEFEPETRPGVEPIDADLACFILDRNSQTREDEDFVFYNNVQGAQLAVKLYGDESVDRGDSFDEVLVIDFEQLPYDVWTLVLGAAVYQGVQRDQSFDTLKHAMLVFKNEDEGTELCRIPFKSNMPECTAVKIAELTRSGTHWTVKELREGTKEGMGAIATAYGLQIASVS